MTYLKRCELSDKADYHRQCYVAASPRWAKWPALASTEHAPMKSNKMPHWCDPQNPSQYVMITFSLKASLLVHRLSHFTSDVIGLHWGCLSSQCFRLFQLFLFSVVNSLSKIYRTISENDFFLKYYVNFWAQVKPELSQSFTGFLEARGKKSFFSFICTIYEVSFYTKQTKPDYTSTKQGCC